jgi:Secretion system C-terminal sorting domain
MNKNLLLTTLLLLFSSYLFCQTLGYGWHTNAPANANSSPYYYKEVLHGDTLFVFSNFGGDSLDADPSAQEDWIYDQPTSQGSQVHYLTKLKLDGTYITSFKLIESRNYLNVYDAAVDQNGQIILIGTCDSTVDFDPTIADVGTYNINLSGSFGAFYSNNGVYSSHFEYANSNSPNNSIYLNNVKVDPNNQLIITAEFFGTVDFDFSAGTDTKISNGESDIALIKINLTNQTYVWTKTIGSDLYDYIGSMDINNGQIALMGMFQGPSIDIDPNAGSFVEYNPNSIVGQDKLFITTWDLNGNFIRTISMAGTYDAYPIKVKIDPFNNIYLLGEIYTSGAMDINPTAVTENLTNNYDYGFYLIKYDNYLNPQWGKTLVSDDYLELTDMDATGSYLALSGITDGLLIQQDANNQDTISTANSYNMLIGTFNTSNASPIELIKYESVGNHSYVQPNDIAVGPDQNIYCIGGLQGLTDFNPFNGTLELDSSFQEIGPYYEDNGFVIGLNWLGFAGIEDIKTDHSIIAYPNPTADYLNFKSSEIMDQITIMDLSGKLVLYKSALESKSALIDISNLSSGIYLASILTHGQTITKKIIKE